MKFTRLNGARGLKQNFIVCWWLMRTVYRSISWFLKRRKAQLQFSTSWQRSAGAQLSQPRVQFKSISSTMGQWLSGSTASVGHINLIARCGTFDATITSSRSMNFTDARKLWTTKEDDDDNSKA